MAKELLMEKAIRSLVIVDDDVQELHDLQNILSHEEYNIAGVGKDSFDAVKMSKDTKPDVLVIDAELPSFNGINVSKNLAKNGYCKGIIYIVSRLEKDTLSSLESENLISIIERPINEMKIVAAMKLGEIHLNNVNRLNEKLQAAEQQLAERKKIDYAKGILIDYFKWTEAEAYRYIQKESMTKHLSMGSVAEVIILTNTGTV